ncbi:MAG: hypothetical protein H6727_15000 [Myxococcales bacterium]|nr:hypothetical protein [Myxococcales bacterium]
MFKTAWLGCLVTGICFFLSSSAYASQACYQLSVKGKHIEAARCFRKEADQIKPTTKDPFRRSIRGNLLRNSALAYFRASRSEKDESVRAYHKERAVSVLKRFLKEQLCSGKGHCAQVRQRMDEIARSIQYKKLEVAAPQGVRTRVVIQGYRFREVHYTPWAGRVRPGKYMLVYQSAKKKVRRHPVKVDEEEKAVLLPLRVVLPIPPDEVEEIVRSRKRRRKARTTRLVRRPKKRKILLASREGSGVAPQEPKEPKEPVRRPPPVRVVERKPPPRREEKKPPVRVAEKKPPKKEKKKVALVRKKPPKKPKKKPPSVVGPAILMAVGGAALLGGGIAAGIGYGQVSEVGQTIEALRKDADQRTPEEQILATKNGLSAAQLQERLGGLETQITVGWILVGAAAAIGGAGLIWFLVQRANYKPDPPEPPKKPAPNARVLFSSQPHSSLIWEAP